MEVIVQKFGGTSVEDPTAINRVVNIIKSKEGYKRLVVVSALAGVTNSLIKLAELAYEGNLNESLNLLNQLKDRHKAVVTELLEEKTANLLLSEFEELFLKIKNMIYGVNLLGELTLRSLDHIMSFGEVFSSKILYFKLKQEGDNVALVNAYELIKTNSDFGNAIPDLEATKLQTDLHLISKFLDFDILITQGFIGSNSKGIITTLGRGGSDYSASLLGAAINAKEIEIWTDVDGIMTADPRIVPEARLISEINFKEASELAYFGAKVLHPKTILPAVQKNIPVRILNSRNPNLKGTKIISSDSINKDFSIKSIAYKKGITIINVYSSRMLLAYGFLEKLFSIFSKYKKSVDVISTSEVSVSLTIDNMNNIDKIEKELSEIGEILIESNKAIICIVGENIKKKTDVVARIFSTLAQEKIQIDMISQGASEINVTLVIDEAEAEKAVRILHKQLFC